MRLSKRNLGGLAVVAVLALPLITAACWNTRTGESSVPGIAEFTLPAFPETGAHKFVVFSEMHYQPTYRSQEGPRLLPPADSVPVTGRELDYFTQDEYTSLQAPVQAYDPSRAAELYRVNCSVCHGLQGRGDGAIGAFITSGPKPADLTAAVTAAATDGDLFGFLTRGGRQGLAAFQRDRETTSPMPPFRNLLSEEERWQVVSYVRSLQGR